MRGPVPGFSIRAYGSSLSLVLIKRYSARARGVVGRGLEKPGILRGAWPYGTSRARGGGLWPALIKRVVHVRGPVPGFSIRGAWPYGTSRARGGGLWPALIKRVAHVRGPVPGFSIRAYGSSLSLVLIKRYSARARGVVGRGLEKPGILRGAWPHGTSRARGGGLWPALIKRVAHVRGVWLVGDWKSLAMGGVWPGAVHLGWSKSPRWMGARRCAGVSFPGWAGRKQF